MQRPSHGAPTKLTRISYAYSGASGISEKREIELAGGITSEQREALFGATRGETHMFIPEQIGLEHLGSYTDWDFPSEGDHCWHELTEVEELPHLYRSVDPAIEPWEPLSPFVDKFVAAGRAGWDVVTCGAQGELGPYAAGPQNTDEDLDDACTREVSPETLDQLAREIFGDCALDVNVKEDRRGPEANRAGS